MQRLLDDDWKFVGYETTAFEDWLRLQTHMAMVAEGIRVKAMIEAARDAEKVKA